MDDLVICRDVRIQDDSSRHASTAERQITQASPVQVETPGKDCIMNWLLIAFQLVIALGLLNVWLLRSSRATPYRGADAQNMSEEFAAYGLPPWFMWVIGTLKVTLSLLLIVGLWYSSVTAPVAAGLAVLMLGAVVMHFKVGDPIRKCLPATAVMILCVTVAVLSETAGS